MVPGDGFFLDGAAEAVDPEGSGKGCHGRKSEDSGKEAGHDGRIYLMPREAGRNALLY